ncbi:MAG TPA: GNAT family N-acetyltransferase [Tepidisphaeraceae bacterium]|jgi:CelD/BcsL family acetyltransferase involved in cellulose biosynthesis/glycosyltransferase involved in cell wall biosynthesis|nr:GNAT family N-acetyltransferase [Tepidisphaeraceae bacterium]
MKLTVLSVAYPFAPVDSACVGGAEQVLSHLDAALVRGGHRSIVVAAAGSTPAGTLIATSAPGGLLTDEKRRAMQREHLLNIEHALDHFDVDVIHFHGIDFHEYLPDRGPAALVTLHLPPGWYPPGIFQLERPRTFLHCVSQSQQRACPAGANLLPVIENGVPQLDLPTGVGKRKLALMLGRICPEKNFHAGLDAAARAGVGAILAGCVFPYAEHEDYFQRQIIPRLSRAARFVGPVDPKRKSRLLAAARCLLVPSIAPETSSLVAMEALAAGTPVIAFRSGALPDIVEHGITGFLVDDEEEMAAAIAMVDRIDPDICRAIARDRFGLQGMIDKYFAIYRQLASADPGEAMEGFRAGENGVLSNGGLTEVYGSERDLSPREMPVVEEITTVDALERLSQEWSALWAEDMRATPFQSPEWLIPWWRHVGRGTLWVLALRDRSASGRLVGVVPWYVFVEPDTTKRQIFPFGIATTDYLDGVFAAGWEARCVEAALAHLDAHSGRWDECELPQLRPRSPLLSQPAPTGWTDTMEESDPCPAVALAATSDGPAAPLPRSIVQNLAYYRRRAQRAGLLRAEVAHDGNLQELFEAWFRLHGARWSVRDQAGVLSGDAVRRWHADALPGLLALGALRLHALRLDGKIIAVCHVLASDGRRHERAHYYYLGGFDPEYSALSPGTLLVGHAIDEAVREGADVFDFLRGREAYKYRWGARDRRTYRRRLRHAGANGIGCDAGGNRNSTPNPAQSRHAATAREP